MNNSEIFVGLDIGTSSIKVIVAESVAGKVNVIGVGSERSEGVSRGVIVDIDKASESIKKAINKAEKQSNLQINDVIINIPSTMLEIAPCQGMIAVGTQSKEITENDVRQVMAAAMVQNLQGEREVVSLKPLKFNVDGFSNIRDPRGMIGVRLEMNGIIYTAPKNIVHNAQMAIKKAGLNISHEVVSPIALSDLVLSEGERNFGSVIIDMGAGQTSASVIHDKNLKMVDVDYEGGNHITHDISVVLNTTVENASHYKIYYGNADSKDVSTLESFQAEVVGKAEPETITFEYLSQIIEARVEQVFNRLKEKLDEKNALDLPGGVIITGGVAATPGVESLAKRIFGVQTKVFTPEQMGMRYPSFSLGLSLVYYAAMLSDVERIANDVVLGNEKKEQPSDNSEYENRGFMDRFSRKNDATRTVEETDSTNYENDEQEEIEQRQSTKSKAKNAGETAKSFWNRFFD
ncbi:cell division protein FtsA [Companilactobacillus sp. RD055328]|uniref:cell division protein FtsA n=1 Tax=Companilactobacillus sp. RD055328 TaxID=2916634 RepID=UPI001FC8C85D|nr:cell division protein FtsA [Companilactobacillus sp. RD055328]GKQ42847.1 cell division protein FtsA [Companilactobacillus sp. RD055328]